MRKFLSNNRQIILASLISLSLFLIFFYRLFLPGYLVWGSDFENKHYPARVYLYEQIVEEHRFPFWTEKMFGGFPIYADFELGYLNPINIVSLLIFGPNVSVKFLLLFHYLVGSISLYLLLKRFGFGLLSFTAANLAFYFAYFLINHQIHLNLILISYLMPLNILLVDIAVQKIKEAKYRSAIKYLSINSIIFGLGLLWGHPQTSLLIMIGVFIYSVLKVWGSNAKKIYLVIGSNIFIGVSSILLTLYQYLPTLEVYLQSKRFGEGTVDFLQGSLTTSLFSLIVYPQVWGIRDEFIGRYIDGSYSYTEAYVYVGIVVFSLAIFGFIFTRLDFICKYFFAILLLFLFFCFLSYVPFIKYEWPILSSFRYWIRSVLIFQFALALLVAKVVHIFETSSIRESMNISYKRIVLILLPFIGLLLAAKLNFNHFPDYNVLTDEEAREFIIAPQTLIWLILAIITWISIYLMIRYRNIRQKILVFLIFVIFADFLFFSQDLVNYRFRPDDVQIDEIPDSLGSVRTLNNSENYLALKGVYYDTWSPLGYSQFAPNDYIKILNNAGMKATKTDDLTPSDFKFSTDWEEIGVNAYVSGGTLELINENTVGNVLKSPEISYVEVINREEGDQTYLVKADTDTILETTIRNYKDMSAFVDGNEVVNSGDSIFISIPVTIGEHNIVIRYFPRLFYIGLLCSVIYISGLMLVFRFSRKYI